MPTKKSPNPFAKVKTTLGRCTHFRDERDAALKAAAASLAQLEALVDSEAATDAEVDAAEVAFEKTVDAFVELDRALSAACDSALADCQVAALTFIEAKTMAKA